MYKKFEKLLEKTHKTTYRVSKETGIAQNVFSNWKSGRSVPKTDKLKILADYFGVSIEYFLEQEEYMDKKYVTYELSLIQEVMHFLNEVNTDKSKRLLRKMICPNPRKEMSEEEIQIRCMTNQERLAALYGSSLPKDSDALKTLRMLCESTKSENCK